MAKKKEVVEVDEACCEDCTPISPIVELFGSGDLNVLRDKINEIIARG